MRKTLAIALLAAFAAPSLLSAADNTRFPPIPADKQTPKQKEVEDRIKAYNAGNVRAVSLEQVLAKYRK